jgi:hypothetical protein
MGNNVQNVVTVQTPPTIVSPDNQQSMGYTTERGKIDGVSERLQNVPGLALQEFS